MITDPQKPPIPQNLGRNAPGRVIRADCCHRTVGQLPPRSRPRSPPRDYATLSAVVLPLTVEHVRTVRPRMSRYGARAGTALADFHNSLV